MKIIINFFLSILFATTVYAVDDDGSGSPKSNENQKVYLEIKVDDDGSGLSSSEITSCINVKVDDDGSGLSSSEITSCINVKVDDDGSGSPYFITKCTLKN